jgi:Single domain von Willebrand factor type C
MFICHLKTSVMNFRIIIFVIASVILSATTYSPAKIFNTKSTNANGADVCSYDNVEILPLQTLNQPEKCQELFCEADFTINISNCKIDPSGKCHWDGADNSLSYPECCGFKLCT